MPCQCVRVLRHLEFFIIKVTIIAGWGRKGVGNEESSTVDRVENDQSLVVTKWSPEVSGVLNEVSGVCGLGPYPIGVVGFPPWRCSLVSRSEGAFNGLDNNEIRPP